MRDSQRSRLYRAELLAESVFDDDKKRPLSETECRKLVDHVVKLRTKGRVAGPMRIRVVFVNGHRSALAVHSWNRGRLIKLPVFARRRLVVLHEIAHHLAGLDQEHGPAFARCYLELVRTFIGQAEAAVLRQAFKEGRVRHRRINNHANL